MGKAFPLFVFTVLQAILLSYSADTRHQHVQNFWHHGASHKVNGSLLHPVPYFHGDEAKQYELLLTLPSKASSNGNSTSKFIPPDAVLHKDLWPPNTEDIVGLLLASLAIFIAAGGGVGGGGVLVPLFILLLKFRPEHAVALSNLTIAGGALANLACNLSRKHPAVNRPLIDWDLLIVMEPVTIVGAVIGGFANKVLPTWLTCILMSALLLAMSYKLWIKSIVTFKKETLEMSHQAALLDDSDYDSPEIISVNDAVGPDDGPTDTEQPLLDASQMNKHIFEAMMYSEYPLLDSSASEVQHILAAEAVQVPKWKAGSMVLMFTWLLITAFLKAFVPCGSLLYWTLVTSIIPPVIIFVRFVSNMLMHNEQVKTEAGVQLVEGDIRWTKRTTMLYPALCSFAGLIAGLFGVGGGIVKGPLMLELGVLPEVTAATSATMILFTSGSASIVYVAFGSVKLDYGVLYTFVGFFVTLAGQLLTYEVIRTLGRRSVIIIAMSLLLSIGFVIMCYESVLAYIAASKTTFFPDLGICT